MRFLLIVPLLAAAVAFPAEDSTNVNLKKRALTCSGATYDVPAFSTCIESCNMKAGLLFYNDFSKDPASPGFIKSLSYECDSANPDRTSFMTKAGICMVGCTTAEQDGYTNNYKAMCGWYTEHKNDVCPPPVIPEPTTSSIPEIPSPSAIESVTPSTTPTSSSASVTDSSSVSEVVPTSPPTSVFITPTASPTPPSGKCVTYDGPVPAPCIQGCLLVSGRKLWNRYIWKPTSENFIPSLGYECDSSNPNHEQFLSSSASCVQSCTSYPDYQSKQGPICSWYEANKANTICAAPVPTVTPTTTVSETPSPTCQPFSAPDRGQCINNCNDQAGKTFFGDYSQDPQNASFMKSLSLECDSEDSAHTSFMIKAGTCMVGCSTEEQGKYTDGYRAVCNWYTANKQGGFCNPGATSVSSSVVQTPTASPTDSPSPSVSVSPTISSTGPTPTCVASAPYTGPLFGSCINNCNEQAGKALFGDFSKDPTSPNLIKSLSFECDSTNPQRTAFMTKAGICMVGCTTAEQDTYTNGYKAMCNWYQEHKNDTPGNCPDENTTSVSSSLPTTIPTSVAPTASVTASPSPSSTCTPGGGPSYNGPTFSTCIDNCNEQAGKALFGDFSKDPTSPNLIKSLSFECDSTNPQRTAFMTKAGICMVGCTTAEQDGYTNGYKAMCNWYEQNKNSSPNTCTGENTSSNIVIPTTVVPSNTVVPTGSATASPAPSGTCTPGGAPAYTGPTFSTCINSCNDQAGKVLFSDFSKDPTSPNLIKSLSFECDSTNPQRTAFMTKAGICMVGCTTAEQDGYTSGYKAMCNWYEQNKNSAPGTCTGGNTPSGTIAPTTVVPTASATASPAPSGTCTPGAAPVYTGPTFSNCINSCNDQAGKALFGDFSKDPTSPNLIKSLSFECDSTNPQRTAFMTKAGICMVGCTTAEQDGYTNGYKAMCNWYEQNKNSSPGTCTGGNTPSGTIAPSTAVPTASATASPAPSGTCTPGAAPSYTGPTFSTCINSCNDQAGKALFGDFSKDPTSPNLIKSLSFECDSTNPQRTAFMTKAGICMVGCNTAEQDGYTNGYKAMCNWYEQNKNSSPGTCTGGNTPSGTIAPSTAVPTASATASPAPSGTCTPGAAPAYTGPTFSTCINSCNDQAGKALFGDFSKDPTSPNLIKSLSFECDSTNPQRTAFMTKAGICMVGCTTAEQDGYTNGYKAMCNWYEQNKNSSPNTCTGGNTSSNVVIPTTVVPSDTVVPTGSATASPAPSGTCTPGAAPAYTGPTFSTCINSCNDQAGKALFGDFSKDPTSPNLIKSLSFECDSTNPQRTAFMTKAGICMVGCTTTEQDGYTNGYKAMCNWYEQNKDSSPGTCTGGNIPSGTAVPSTAVPTGSPTATCQVSTVTVTSTATVTVTVGGVTPLPTATPATCNHGSYACEASGTSAKFTICVWGRYESQMCAPGTVCKTAGNSIICDWA